MKDELNFKNILKVAGKLKYSNLLFSVDNEKFCKCCVGINTIIKNNMVINKKCTCIGHEHGELNIDEILKHANDKIDKKFNAFNKEINTENIQEEQTEKEETSEFEIDNTIIPDPYGNSDYIIYSDNNQIKSNQSSTESIYKRLFNNMFRIDSSQDNLNNENNDDFTKTKGRSYINF